MASINLTNLPTPKIIEELSFDQIFSEMLTNFKALSQEYTSVVEGDPAYSILQVAAYREVGIRKRVNDAIRSVYVKYAIGADLDNVAALYGTYRRTNESDESLRQRASIVFETISPASPAWFELKVAAVDDNIREVQAVSPSAGNVTAYVQSVDNNGIPSDALKTKIENAIVGEEFFSTTISKATAVNYAITATITIDSNVIAVDVLAAVTNNANDFVFRNRRFGNDIPLSSVYESLSHDNVSAISLSSPTADITTTDGQIPVCTAVTLTVA